MDRKNGYISASGVSASYTIHVLCYHVALYHMGSPRLSNVESGSIRGWMSVTAWLSHMHGFSAKIRVTLTIE